jgi:hypothetical protein
MKITFESQQVKKGYALVITMLFLFITVLALTSVWLWTANNGNLTQRNITFNQSSAAAEAATEKVFTTMNRDFHYGNLSSDSNTYNVLIPDTSNTNLWPIQYKFSDTNGNANRTYVSIGVTNFEPLNSQYAGLQGIAQDCTIISVATPTNGRDLVPATVMQSFQAAQIPVFQFAIFYNLDMEMDPTPAMVVKGSVFCNQNIWVTCVNSLMFNSTVQAVGKVTDNTDVDPIANNGYSYGGTAPTFSLTGQPNGGNDPLTMPIGTSTNSNPTNVEAILNLPPSALGAPNTIAYAESNQVYLFNESDLIISNAAWGTNGIAFNGMNGAAVNTHTNNFTVWYQDLKGTTPLTQLTNDYIKLKLTTGNFTNFTFQTGGLNANNYAATNILYAGFSFLTNVVFYDWREGYNGGSGPGKTVQAVQINVTNLTKWLSGTNINGVLVQGASVNSTISSDLGHGIGSVYVYNSVPLSSTTLPAVRLVNGALLPTYYPGLTVSTPMPLYIYGDYNVRNNAGVSDLGKSITTHTYPAAVLCDALTILSDSWNDATTTKMPAVNIDTTVNAAVLEGIVPSNTNITYAANGPGYSGGVENVLRYVEDWSGNTNTYNGSIVVMFPSIYATNSFHGGGTYYNPPSRNWSFDLNFQTASGLPPLTPKSRSLIRGNWSAY